MNKKLLVPLALFLGLVAFLAVGLTRDPRELPSPLVGKPAPAFQLPTLAGTQVFTPQQMKGHVWLLNVWASWCGSCREEHPWLLALARSGRVPVVGLDYKDTPDAARRWLAQQGDPYQRVAVDADGRVGIDYGVYGVPETYVIDKAGTIRFKQVGPLSEEALRAKVLPLIEELQR